MHKTDLMRTRCPSHAMFLQISRWYMPSLRYFDQLQVYVAGTESGASQFCWKTFEAKSM